MDCFISSKSDGANVIRKAAGELPELPAAERSEHPCHPLQHPGHAEISEPHLENSCSSCRLQQNVVLGRRMDQLPLEGGSQGPL